MSDNTEAFAALKKYNQFIIYKLVFENNHASKKPLSYKTGLVANPLDVSNHTDFDTACASASLFNAHVGFVLTKNDPFFLLDIDSKNYTEKGWSSTALYLNERLNHAAFELSSSGKGLHIIASCDALEHTCKNSEYDIELYTENRFIALTFNAARGNAAHDYTNVLRDEIIPKFFKKTVKENALAWSNTAKDESFDTISDKDIIAKAIASKSAMSIFSEKITFSDLWYARTDALINAYPTSNSNEFNASAADLALASHLIFHTRGNCERVKRLMFESALVREKWNRDSYLESTILKACENQKSLGVNKIEKNEHVADDTLKNPCFFDTFHPADVLTEDVKPIDFLIDKILPRRTMTLLSAHGGAGKSTFALQLAIAVALGKPILNQNTTCAKVLFLSAEDEKNTMLVRAKNICAHYGYDISLLNDERIRLIDATRSPCLAAEQSKYGQKTLIQTESYHKLHEMISEYKPDLIIIDNASDTYDANENDRGKVRAFARSLIALAELSNAALLLLSHIDKSSAKVKNSESYSGSTAWHNSARSRLHLATENDLLKLSHQKSNYSALAQDVYFKRTSKGVLEQTTAPLNNSLQNLENAMRDYEDGNVQILYKNAYSILKQHPSLPSDISKKEFDSLLKQAEEQKVIVRVKVDSTSANPQFEIKLITN